MSFCRVCVPRYVHDLKEYVQQSNQWMHSCAKCEFYPKSPTTKLNKKMDCPVNPSSVNIQHWQLQWQRQWLCGKGNGSSRRWIRILSAFSNCCPNKGKGKKNYAYQFPINFWDFFKVHFRGEKKTG